MIERFVAWYWLWIADIILSDLEEAVNNPDYKPTGVYSMSVREWVEFGVLLVSFPVAVACTIWVVEVRGITDVLNELHREGVP